METSARYILVGVFAVVAIVAGFGFVYWLNNNGGLGKRDAYEIRFQGAVSGLQNGRGRPIQRYPRRRSDRTTA